MKFKYLGTAAAEGIPAVFCDCDICTKARQLGGKNIKTRSQAIVDNRLLIDLPSDTYMHVLLNGISLSKIKACLITHSHEDHLYATELAFRKTGFSHLEDSSPMIFYSDMKAYEIITDTIQKYQIDKEVSAVKIDLHKEYEIEGYKVFAIRASHSKETDPVVYTISDGEKGLMYAHDTSDFSEEEWEHLIKYNMKLDLVSLDCTEGDRPIDYVGHMNIERCNKMRERLLSIGLADNNTKFVLNHFSHNGFVLHDEFEKIAKTNGFLVSYDGMEIEL